MTRLALAAVAAACLALPGAAGAASISYIGPDGNAYLSSPDGATKVQLTRDGTADSKYKMAGQADDGRVVVFRGQDFTWLNPDGTVNKGPVHGDIGPYSGTGPITAHVIPSGSMVAWWASDFGPGFSSSVQRIVFMPDSGHTGECAFRCDDGFVLPRWVPGTLAGFIEDNFDAVWIQVTQNSNVEKWFSLPGLDINNFDPTRDGSKIVVETSPDLSTDPSALRVVQMPPIPPTGQTPAELCSSPNFSPDGTARPHWSPDGTQIAWQDAAGVQVSPINPGAPGCGLAPRLLVAGGSSPEWGPKDVPGAGPGPGPGPGTAFKLSLKAGRLPKLGAALRNGVTISFNVDRAGQALVELLAKGKLANGVATKTKTVAKGSKKATRAGTVKVKVRFTRKAKRRYKRLRKLTLTARATLTAGGTKGIKQLRITLRR